MAEKILQKLYNGKIEIAFYPDSHRYKIEGQKDWLISVTAATGMINKPLLIDWAVKLMREELIDKRNRGVHIDIPMIIEASSLHRVRKEEAATKGKSVHKWCQNYILFKTKQRTAQPEEPTDEQVYNGVMAFLDWEQQNKIKWLASEKMVYSKKYNYVGQMDAKAEVNGQLCVIDFKTGNAIYNEMRYQTAAYQAADEEETNEKYTGDRWIVRFDKDTAQFEAKQYGDFDRDFAAFLGALELKKREKELSGIIIKKKVNLDY
jgi:hypothetical protein